MSLRGLDPTCPSTIKREPSSPSPSSQGDVSPAQPSPEGSSSDTNSSYGPLNKGHSHSNGLDSPGLYGHSAGLANNVGPNRLVSLFILLEILFASMAHQKIHKRHYNLGVNCWRGRGMWGFPPLCIWYPLCGHSVFILGGDTSYPFFWSDHIKCILCSHQ